MNNALASQENIFSQDFSASLIDTAMSKRKVEPYQAYDQIEHLRVTGATTRSSRCGYVKHIRQSRSQCKSI